MGVEPKQEKSIKQQHFEELERKLTTMLNMYDKTEVLTLIREVYEVNK